MFENILRQNIASHLTSIIIILPSHFYIVHDITHLFFIFNRIKLSFFTKAMSFDRYTHTVIPNDQGTHERKIRRVRAPTSHQSNEHHHYSFQSDERASHNYCLCFEQFILKWKAICICKLNARSVSRPNVPLPG